MKAKDVVLSICCVTYNHEKYIRQCLDGFVMQKTNFEFEILVHEDASTDTTANILKEYELKFPHLFRCVYQTENQFLKQNTLVNILFKMAKGKYIALCEGDDYWTDPVKLQKQVDFLEGNDRYGLVYTNYRKLIDKDVYENDKEFRSYQNLDGYFRDGCPFLFTGSWLMKNEIRSLLFRDIKYANLPGDVQILCHVLGSKYKVHYLNEITGVYRTLEESASHSLVNNKDKDFALVKYLLLMKYKNQITKHTFTKQLEKLIQNKFQYFQYFKLGLIGRFGLYKKIAKIKGVNRASRFVIYNVS